MGQTREIMLIYPVGDEYGWKQDFLIAPTPNWLEVTEEEYQALRQQLSKSKYSSYRLIENISHNEINVIISHCLELNNKYKEKLRIASIKKEENRLKKQEAKRKYEEKKEQDKIAQEKALYLELQAKFGGENA